MFKSSQKSKSSSRSQDSQYHSRKALDIEPQSKKSYLCSVHPEEPLKLYCKSCKSLACLLCFVGLHNGHDIGSIDGKTRQKVEQSINNLVKETDSKLIEFEDNLKYVSALEKEKTKAHIPLKAQVDKKVNFLIQQLEARRKELHKEIDDACTKDLKELWAQKEYHETAITSMEGALSFARRALACKEDTEILALCAQVTSRLKELSQLKWDSQDTEKIERKTVEFKEADKQSYAQKTDTTVGEIHVRMSTPKKIEITTTELQNRVPFSYGCSITFQVTAAVNYFKRKPLLLTASATYRPQRYDIHFQNSYCSCTTEQNATANSWTVKFTPPERTTYTITLQVSDEYEDEYEEEYDEKYGEYDEEVDGYEDTYLHHSSDYQIEVY